VKARDVAAPPALEPLYTVAEAAEALRISPRTVYRLIEAGEIGAVRIGKQWRIPRTDMGIALADPPAPPEAARDEEESSA
jgi:excisionase family DNA binding protein